MRPDAAPLAQAAARRHELTRAKAIQALRELDRAGTPVTFAAVASAAGISRSWLYTQPDIREEVSRLRDLGRRAPGTPVPAHHHSSDASLLRRLEAALAERGCLKVNLQVRAANAGVVAFYEKLGYTVEERVSMGKRLY